MTIDALTPIYAPTSFCELMTIDEYSSNVHICSNTILLLMTIDETKNQRPFYAKN